MKRPGVLCFEEFARRGRKSGAMALSDTERHLGGLAAWAAGLRLEDIPAEVKRRAALVVLDLIGCNVAGSRDDGMPEFAAALGRRPGRATLAGTPVRADPAAAALFNASAIVALELDETNLFAKGHPGAHVWPAVLAAVEDGDRSGADLLTAFVAGYETGARVGRAAHLSPAVHPHGTAVAVAAAAGLARLWEFPAPAFAAAVQQAAALVVPADWNAARLGGTVRNLFAGAAAQNAFAAAESVRCGLTHDPAALDAVFGQILGARFEAASLSEGLGEIWAFKGDLYFKHHACCLSVHSALDALLEMRRRQPFDPADVRRVTVETYRSAALLGDQEPVTPLAAKFSIPHALAAAMVLGETGPAAFDAASLRNQSIRTLSRRVDVSENPALTARLPASRPARVVVTLDAREIVGECTRSEGLPTENGGRAIQEKFMGLAEPVIGTDAAAAVRETVRRLEVLPNVAALTSLLRT
jgi:2-methylcitrate dehydratase PrpD